jgi:site-specific DNA-methyltransferase (adenine-specific)
MHLDFKVKLEAFWKGDAGTPCYLDNAGVVVSYSKPIWVYSKGPFTRKGRFITPIGPFPREKDWHPHQQPLELFKHLVREFTDPGDMVLDPCGGGFTTALACYLLGRRCISCDIDKKAVMLGMERLNKAMRGEPDRP